MVKFFQFLPATLLVAGFGLGFQTHAADFEIEENFDNEASFSQGGVLPDGWTQNDIGNFSRRDSNEWYGYAAQSGNFVLAYGSQDGGGVLYTAPINLAAGKKATIEFRAYMPGGQPAFVRNFGLTIFAGKTANIEEMTQIGSRECMATPSGVQWESLKYEFTPEEDGEYYFAIRVDQNGEMNRGGYVFLDTFFFSGTEPEGTGPIDPPGPDIPDGETFETHQNFDNDTDFDAGAVLPRGWSLAGAADLARGKGIDFGKEAASGEYVLGTADAKADGIIFTAPVNLAGGKEAGIRFMAYRPGSNDKNLLTYCNLGLTVFAGTEADIAKMQQIGNVKPENKADWENLSFAFTPEADGEYFFAIRIDKGLIDPYGMLLLDSFIFTGTAPGGDDPNPPGPGPDDPDKPNDPVSTYPGMDLLEPDEENLSLCQELPYFENFSNGDHYDGGVLPKGWTSTGSNIWRTASRINLPAVSGDYYITTIETSIPRDERAYTPFFNLQKGVTYTLAFSTHQTSTLYDEEENIRRITIIRVGAGTQHDSEFIPVTMKEISTDNPAGTWSDHELTFCPAESGPYCFCFELEGLPYSGIAAIDDIRITSAVDLARPEPNFVPKGIYNIFTSSLLAIGDEPVRIVNTSEYAEQVEWKIPEGLVSNVLPNGDIDVFFPESGSYTIELTATNAKGSRTTSKTLDIEHMDAASEDQMAVAGYDPNASYFFTRDNLPRFSTDPNFDFVSGYNHYYNTYAEFYNLPDNYDFALRQISVWMPWLNYRNTYGDANITNETIKPFNVKIVGMDENGLPDENKIFGTLETTMKDVFGVSGTNELNARDIVFAEPVICKGPIFVIFEYSPDLDMEPEIPEFTRSYIAIDIVKHKHNQTTMFVKPYHVPDDVMAEEGKWCPVHDFSRAYKGYGLGFELWTSAPAGTIYTAPVTLQGGKEAAIEFQALIPSKSSIIDSRQLGISVFAGTSPNLSSMTKIGTRAPGATDEWEKIKFSFTPENDANYYYALRIDNCMTHPEAVMLLDSFVFTGSNPDDDSAVVIKENFDNDVSFDAEAALPRKWKQESPANFSRNEGSEYDKTAHSGNYVIGMGPSTNSVVAIGSDGNIIFAARYAAGSIEVSGTTEGEWLAVYTTEGKCVAMARANEGFTRIAADIPAGLYIVRGDKSAAKFLK